MNPKAPKSTPLRARLDADLAGQVEREARERGTSISAVIREALQERYRPQRRAEMRQIERLTEAVEALAKEMHPIGSNLNQIAWAFNSSGKLAAEDLSKTHNELRLEFSKTRRVLKAVENALTD